MKKIIKNKRGFSLVELIIVIAIMVALVAIMSPSYIKYVQRSADAVVTAAAEDCFTFCRSEFSSGNLDVLPDGAGECVLRIGVKDNSNHMSIEIVKGGIRYRDMGEEDFLEGDEALALFKKNVGIEEDKRVKSKLYYEIILTGSMAAKPYTVTLEEGSTPP